MGLENIVVAPLDVTYPRRIVRVDDTPPENVVLKVGDNGTAKTLAYSRSYSLTTYMVKVQKEVIKQQKDDYDQNLPGAYPDAIQPGTAAPVGGLPR